MYALASTGITYGLYKLVLAKRRMFYDFFRKNHKIPLVGRIKKGLSIFMVYAVWVNIWKVGFERATPNEFFKLGLYKKYHLEYEKNYL